MTIGRDRAAGGAGDWPRAAVAGSWVAIWSCPAAGALNYPARYLFELLDHHGMLRLGRPPDWQTVAGYSRCYWQWVAGTGTGTSRHRVFNPTLQGRRLDPAGEYVRRYLPELAGLPAPVVHDLDPATRRQRGYPEPIVDHREAIAAYRAGRRG